jgi:hypothetical protein
MLAWLVPSAFRVDDNELMAGQARVRQLFTAAEEN